MATKKRKYRARTPQVEEPVGTQHSKLSVEDQLAMMRDSAFDGPHRIARQNYFWVVEARASAELALTDTMRPADAALFWIRLFGVVHDLAKHWRDASKQVPVPARGTIGAQRVALARKLARAVAATRAALPKTDRIFLEYRRHFEAHPIQHHYHVKRTRAGTVRTRCEFHLLDGAAVDLEEVQDITSRKLIQFASDAGVAREIAPMVLGELLEVERLANELSASYA